KAQNACTYAKKQGRKYPSVLPTLSPSTTPSEPLPCFPATLLNLARAPHPNTYLFHEALQSAEAVDESDLSQWDVNPPYLFSPPLDTPAEARFTANLADVMHGRRLRQERNA
ncbi:hypothetical protein BJ138DRAFT_983402, partial [Hygrophoropsis aurantiaca]